MPILQIRGRNSLHAGPEATVMAKWKPFSGHLKAATRKPFELFEYENFPEEFRTKLHYLLSDSMLDPLREDTPYRRFNPETVIQHELAKQHGEYALERVSFGNLLQQSSYQIVLDLLEIGMLLMHSDDKTRSDIGNFRDEVNDLFAEYGLGYRVSELEVLRVDAPAITEEAIAPAFTLLSDPEFKAAEREFKNALECLRTNRPEDAVAWSNAAFESTMKVVLEKRKVLFQKDDTARPLIQKVLGLPGLLPPYLTNFTNNLVEVFQGLPTSRNKSPPAHGQGTILARLEREDAQFAINLAATFIVFIVSRDRSTC